MIRQDSARPRTLSSPLVRRTLGAALLVAAILGIATSGSGANDVASIAIVIDTLPARIDTVGGQIDTVPATVVVESSRGSGAVAFTLESELQIASHEPGVYTSGSVDLIAPRRDGGAYIWDRATAAVREFGADGRFVRHVGRSGSGPGEYEDVAGMEVLDGQLVLLDPLAQQVLVYDSSGVFRLAWPVDAPPGLASIHPRDANSIFVRGALNEPRAVYGAEATTAFIAYRGDGTSAGDTVPIPDFPAPRRPTLQAASAGRYVVRQLPFAARSVVGVAPEGAIVGGRGDQYRLDVIRRSDLPMQIVRTVAAAPIAIRERTDSARQATIEMQAVDPSWKWHGPGVPYQKSFFHRILFDHQGRLWVERPLPSVRSSPDDAASRSWWRSAARVWREDVAYDLFDASGRFMGSVIPPPTSRILRVGGNDVWGVYLAAPAAPVAVRWQLVPSRR